MPRSSLASVSVIVNTFRRPDCLRASVVNWLNCSLGELRVVWSEPAELLPQWLLQHELRGEVVVERHSSTNLTNRFAPRRMRPQVSAAFTIDDDVWLSCEALAGAHNVYRHDPRRLVGFAARNLSLHHPGHTAPDGAAGFEAMLGRTPNTVLATKGAFVPMQLFEAFYSPALQLLREAINYRVTAEDILMSFVYATNVSLPVVPVFAPGGVRLCASNHSLGRSTRQHRREVMGRIEAHFGEDALQMSMPSRLGLIDVFTNRLLTKSGGVKAQL
jgi:hypothetical protein